MTKGKMSYLKNQLYKAVRGLYFIEVLLKVYLQKVLAPADSLFSNQGNSLTIFQY